MSELTPTVFEIKPTDETKEGQALVPRRILCDSHYMSYDEISAEMRRYIAPADRLFVAVGTQSFKLAAAYVQSCITEYKFKQKKGCFLMRCCNIIWFGSKPDPCCHIIDDGFRLFTDKRNRKDYEWTFEKESKFAEKECNDNETQTSVGFFPEWNRNLWEYPLTMQMMIRAAKFANSFDADSGLIGLPAIVISSHGRPKGKQHTNCFYAPNSIMDENEYRFRTSVLHFTRK